MQKLSKEQAIKLIENADTIEADITREMIDVTKEDDTTNVYKSGTLHFTIKGKSQSQYQEEG
jgi:methyl coenzyme M reductase beta subunit